MITGNKIRKIKKYLTIDRCGEGYGYTVPAKGEELWGIPYGFYDNSLPFIEHRTGDKVTATINCLDVSVIIFDDETI
jgi:hypothetical protein